MWTLFAFHMRVALISIFDNVKLSINFINKIVSFIIFLYRCNGGQYGSQGFLRNQQFYIQFTPPINNSGLLYSAVSRLWTMLVCSALIDFTRSAHIGHILLPTKWRPRKGTPFHNSKSESSPLKQESSSCACF